MKRKDFEKRMTAFLLAGVLAISNGSSVFAQEQGQEPAIVQNQSEDQPQAENEIERIELVENGISQNHSTYKQLTCGSRMKFLVKVYRKGESEPVTGEDGQIKVELRRKDKKPAKAVCAISNNPGVYMPDVPILRDDETLPVDEHVDFGIEKGEKGISSYGQITVYAPYGYEEDLELVVSSVKNETVKATHSFYTRTDARDGNSIASYDLGTTAGTVKVKKAKISWNATYQKYTVKLPKVQTKSKDDQFVGWTDGKTDLLYGAGAKAEIYGTKPQTFEAVWKTKNGTKFTVKENKEEIYNLHYKVTGKNTVSLLQYEGLCKCIHGLELPNTVEFHNKKYRVNCIETKTFQRANLNSLLIGKYVTKIGKDTFDRDGWLKSIVIKSTSIKSVGKNAFKGIPKTAVISCPQEKVKTYTKLFRKAGLNKKVKIIGYTQVKENE
ncbi:MAG: leucine-rich repeat protein [Lachnospiraceae bacterium]